ncbi:replication protein A subunit RPA32 [Amylocystis lapponica]|nr:replication protein A subunit RPA32 [Amylocystis lapponica]
MQVVTRHALRLTFNHDLAGQKQLRMSQSVFSRRRGNPYYGGGGGGAADISLQRGGGSHSLRPVTIKQLITATQAHSDAEWMIGDVEIAQVTLWPGHLNSKSNTNVVYWLDDGTGRIEARHWVDSADEGENDKNTYIRAIGNLKAFGNKRYINATHLRPAQDFNEVNEHILQAFCMILVAQRGPPPRPSDAARAAAIPAAGGSAAGPSAYTAQAHNSGMNNQYSNLKPLQRQIVQFILSQPRNEEGVHVAAIARSVGGEAVAISEALDSLMDEGHVFSTIDDSHFSVSA